MFQKFGSNLQNHLLVIDQQYRFTAFYEGFRCLRFGRYLPVSCRKKDGERGTLSRLALNADNTVMVPYNAVCRCKPEPRSPAHILGSKERIKNFSLRVLVNPDPGIRDRHSYIPSRFQADHGNIPVFQCHIFGFEIEIAAVRHRLPGIDIQIEKHLLNLSSVNFHRPECFLKFSVNTYLPFGPSKHHRTLSDELVEIRGLHFIFAALCKTEQLSGQIRTLLHILLYAAQPVVVRMI